MLTDLKLADCNRWRKKLGYDGKVHSYKINNDVSDTM